MVNLVYHRVGKLEWDIEGRHCDLHVVLLCGPCDWGMLTNRKRQHVVNSKLMNQLFINTIYLIVVIYTIYLVVVIYTIYYIMTIKR